MLQVKINGRVVGMVEDASEVEVVQEWKDITRELVFSNITYLSSIGFYAVGVFHNLNYIGSVNGNGVSIDSDKTDYRVFHNNGDRLTAYSFRVEKKC